MVAQKLCNTHDYIHYVTNIRHYQNQTFSHQDTHNITKLHCTQYAHYTILQSYTVRTLHNKSQYLGDLHVSKSNGPVDITIQHLFVVWKHCLYLNSFSTLTYMVISTIYTISSHKSILLIQISDNAYKCKNFYSILLN